MHEIKFKLSLNATLPCKGTSGSAGWDIHSVEDVVIHHHQIKIISTGVFLELPPGFEAQIRTRSGMATKGVSVVNSPGTIDSDYRGEVKVILINLGINPYQVKKGDRIAQVIFQQLPLVELVPSDSFTETKRNTQGFGSTGR